MNQPNLSDAGQPPKIVQRRMVRYAAGLMSLAVIVILYQMLKSCGQDIDLPLSVDTAGMITAVQLDGSNSKVAVIEPDGTIKYPPGASAEFIERDAIWRPDGNRVFFTSNRTEGNYNLFRWNLGSEKVEQRSLGTRSKSSPTFLPAGADGANDSALLMSGGFVLDCNLKTGETRQILPPVVQELGGGDEGAGEQLGGVYNKLGTSFRTAKWTFDKRFIVAVMRREDGNEALIVQEMGAKQPMPVVAGRHIDIEVSPDSSKVYYSVLEFQWLSPADAPPEFVKNGRVTTPYRHGVFAIDLDRAAQEANQPIVMTKEDTRAIHRICLSPDGSMLAAVRGSYTSEGDLEPMELIVFPTDAAGGSAITVIKQGKIFEPSWGPNSDLLLYIESAGGRRAIHTIRRDGSDPKNVTGTKGDFAWPRMSPQGGK
ncbi:MAG: PD40 domain-containing protein [Armatimonadetes bacterium]|nr:PD40 domain-containing protein [Armatimonadota bacterium]